jgi:ribosomal protein S12 methylthiotransferase accessory factor
VALWEAQLINERVGRVLALESIDHADCRRLLDAYSRAGMAVQVWNVTSEIGIPTFVCDIVSESRDPSADLPPFRGAGCHPDRAVALGRALTESAQIRLTHIAGIRDDLPASAYKKAPRAKIGAALLHYLSSRAEHCAFQEVLSFETEDLTAEVQWELLQLQRTGRKQVVAVDLTSPEYEIPVVRVIVSGLEGDPGHPDYRPGPRAIAARVSKP